MITASTIEFPSRHRESYLGSKEYRKLFICKIVIGLIIFGVGFSGCACAHLIDRVTVIGGHCIVAILIICSGLKNRREALLIEKEDCEAPAQPATVSLISTPHNVYLAFSDQKYEISSFMAKRSSELASGRSRVLCDIQDVRGAYLVINYLQTLQFPTYLEMFPGNLPSYKTLISALLIAHELNIRCLKTKIEEVLALVLPWSLINENLGVKGTAIQKAAIKCELTWLLRQTYIVEASQIQLQPKRRQEIENCLPPIIDRPSCPAPFEYLYELDPIIVSDFFIPSQIIDLLNPIYKEMLHALIQQSVIRKEDFPILRMLRDYLYCGIVPEDNQSCFDLYRVLGRSLGEDLYQRIPGFEYFWEPSGGYYKAAKREVQLRHITTTTVRMALKGLLRIDNVLPSKTQEFL